MKMKRTVIVNVLKTGRKAVAYLFALSVVALAVLSCIAYNKHLNGHYACKSLSPNVSVHEFYERDELRVYNDSTERYTLKGVQWVADTPRNDSLTVFCRNGKRGFLNVRSGEVAIPEQYRRAWVFSEGVAAVMKGDKLGFVDARNETVLPFRYDYAGRNGMAIDYLFRGGYCTMTDSRGACGLIDRSGRWVIEPQYDCIWPPHEGKYRIVKEGEAYGLLDENLEFVFPIEYEYIEYSGDRGVLLSKDGYKWRADYDGTVLEPFVCDYTDYLSYASGYGSYAEEDGSGDEARYSALTYTLSDYLTYTIGNRCGVVRRDDGKVIVPARYDRINMLSPALFEAQDPKDGHWVFIDIHGKIVGR